jgi:hypothetical protein
MPRRATSYAHFFADQVTSIPFDDHTLDWVFYFLLLSPVFFKQLILHPRNSCNPRSSTHHETHQSPKHAWQRDMRNARKHAHMKEILWDAVGVAQTVIRESVGDVDALFEAHITR